jgi:hypothetical protein
VVPKRSAKSEEYKAEQGRLRAKARKARESVLLRANSECEICGWYSYLPGILNVHHIIPLEQGQFKHGSDPNSPDNLICICPNCHAVVHKAMSRGDDLDFHSLASYYPLEHFRKLSYLMMGITRDQWAYHDKTMSLADLYDIPEDFPDPAWG